MNIVFLSLACIEDSGGAFDTARITRLVDLLSKADALLVIHDSGMRFDLSNDDLKAELRRAGLASDLLHFEWRGGAVDRWSFIADWMSTYRLSAGVVIDVERPERSLGSQILELVLDDRPYDEDDNAVAVEHFNDLDPVERFARGEIDSKPIWALLAEMGISSVVPGKSFLWYKDGDKPDQGSWLYVTAAHVELSAKPGYPIIISAGLDRDDVTVKVCGLLHDPGMQPGKPYQQGRDLVFDKCASVVNVDGKIAAEYPMDEGDLVGFVGGAGFEGMCLQFEGKPR